MREVNHCAACVLRMIPVLPEGLAFVRDTAWRLADGLGVLAKVDLGVEHVTALLLAARAHVVVELPEIAHARGLNDPTTPPATTLQVCALWLAITRSVNVGASLANGVTCPLPSLFPGISLLSDSTL